MQVNFLNINFDKDRPNETYLFMNTDEAKYSLIVQAISLDIRGNYHEILEGIDRVNKFPQVEYEWIGNCFRIKMNQRKVRIYDLSYEVNGEETENEYLESCEIELNEFQEVINEWKLEYLESMGFLKFKQNKALSHLYGVLLLVYDKVNEQEPVLTDEQIRYSIWQAAKRYGRAMTTLYHQCKNVLNHRTMWEFYDWCRLVFVDKRRGLLENIGEEFLDILQ